MGEGRELASMLLSVQSFITRTLNVSKKEAIRLIETKQVFINENPASVNQTVYRNDTILCSSECIYRTPEFLYLALYKPRGIECTLNPDITDNLYNFLPEAYKAAFPVGRLDKESEGLLFLTTDGYFSERILRTEFLCEKEYEVRTANPISNEELLKLSAGIEIIGKLTLPCKVNRTGEKSFSIVLTQGLNRQIRRMFYKLNHQVTHIKRIRIGEYSMAHSQSSGIFDVIPAETVNQLLKGKWPALKA